MQFFIFDASALQGLTAYDSRDDNFSEILRSKAKRIFTNDDVSYCLEAYLCIAGSRGLEFSQGLAGEQLTEATAGDTVWFVFTRGDAQQLLPKLRGIVISERDATDYFGDDDLAQTVADLRCAHREIQQSLAEIGEGQIGVWGVNH